jgi:transposase
VYRERQPQGYSYSRFCELYRIWAAKTDLVMRHLHRAGEKLFVDYARQTAPIINRHSGERRQAQIFVAVLGASNYTFAEATWTRQLPDWLQSHMRAFAFFGGVPELVVPDSLKTGVVKAHRYRPNLNLSYMELAKHYQFTIIPARIRRPRDKATVEVGISVVERWILARLREQTFFSLDDLNRAIAQLLVVLNHRAFKKLDGSRRQWFEQLDLPALRPLPASRYDFAQWHAAQVSTDYHIELGRHYYSVPHQLVRQEVEVRLTVQAVEVFYRGKAVAFHRRAAQVGQHTTVAAHMPQSYREYAGWTPQRLIRSASTIGPYSAQLVEQILAMRNHLSKSYRSCFGILRLAKSYGDQRLEGACRRALAIGGLSYKSVQSILQRKLDQEPLPIAESSNEP